MKKHFKRIIEDLFWIVAGNLFVTYLNFLLLNIAIDKWYCVTNAVSIATCLLIYKFGGDERK